MDLRSLRYFVNAVEHGSISAAAEACHVAQPSISQAIAKLEDELNTRLLERGRSGVKPTADGKDLHGKALRLLADSEAIIQHFRQAPERPTLTISIDIPLRLSRLHETLNRLSRWRESHRFEIVSEARHADIRITSREQCPPDFDYQPLWQDEYALLAPVGHPLLNQTDLQLSDLNGLALIERRFCEWTPLWEDFCQRHALEFDRVASASDEDAALALVAHGIGACLAPAPDPAEHPRLAIIPLSKINGAPILKREIGMVIHPHFRT